MTLIYKNKKTLRVFVSYAHDDERLWQDLFKHLAILEDEGSISVWYDRRMLAGEDFAREIENEIEQSDIILILVSSNSLASDYCRIELSKALRRYRQGWVHIVPVILRPCGWQNTQLKSFNVVPENGKPITDFDDEHKAFHQIEKAIRDIAEGATLKEAPGPFMRHAIDQIWHVPRAQNVNFSGREKILEQIHSNFQASESPCPVQVVHGLAGVGKTQLLIEFAYRYRHEYKLVWWLRSEDPETLTADIGALSEKLGLCTEADEKLPALINTVRGWLDRNIGWLLIFDDVSDAKSLQAYLPVHRKGHILIASRNAVWSEAARPIHIKPMEKDEAASLLFSWLQSTKDLVQDFEDNEFYARELADQLGYLPLALAHAGSYVQATGSSLQGYLSLLQKHEANLFADSQYPADYPRPVAAAWDLSFQALKAKTPDAAHLLNLLVFLGPDDVPLDLLVTNAGALPRHLNSFCHDQLKIDAAIVELRKYSLIERSHNRVSTHRLVQLIARHQMSKRESKNLSAAAIKLMIFAFPEQPDNFMNWANCDILISHASAAAEHAKRLKIEQERTCVLLNRIADFLWARAAYSNAAIYGQIALEIGEKDLRKDDPILAKTLNTMGSIKYSDGRAEDALSFYNRALKIRQRVLDPNDPDLAITLDNLAVLKRELGDSSEALRLHRRALKIFEKAYGPYHIDVAKNLSNLGVLCAAKGDVDNAIDYYRRAMKSAEGALGRDHPNYGSVCGNLGALYLKLGRDFQANNLLHEAVRICKYTLGSNHPEVGERLKQLAMLSTRQRRFYDAAREYAQVYNINKANFGEGDPRTENARLDYKESIRKADGN